MGPSLGKTRKRSPTLRITYFYPKGANCGRRQVNNSNKGENRHRRSVSQSASFTEHIREQTLTHNKTHCLFDFGGNPLTPPPHSLFSLFLDPLDYDFFRFAKDQMRGDGRCERDEDMHQAVEYAWAYSWRTAWWMPRSWSTYHSDKAMIWRGQVRTA